MLEGLLRFGLEDVVLLGEGGWLRLLLLLRGLKVRLLLWLLGIIRKGIDYGMLKTDLRLQECVQSSIFLLERVQLLSLLKLQ